MKANGPDPYKLALLKEWADVDENGCWLWIGATFSNGYGRLRRIVMHAIEVWHTERVHVAMDYLLHGPLPPDVYVLHSCDVKRCFNPNHLWRGTNKQNQDDAVAKGLNTYWTPKRRKEKARAMSGAGNPQFGKLGTCLGRIKSLHPMYGKHHTKTSKQKISRGLRRAIAEGRK